MIPDIYVRARWLRDYSAAIWAPRYLPRGFALYDAEPALLDPLRSIVDEASLDERNLMPELYTTSNAYRNGVSMPGSWITDPPAADASLRKVHCSSILYSRAAAEEIKRIHEAFRPL